MFCDHDWVIVTEKTIDSPIERMTNKPTRMEGAGAEDLAKGTYICILKCIKCGKLNKTIERV